MDICEFHIFLVIFSSTVVSAPSAPIYLEFDRPTIAEISFLEKYGYMEEGEGGAHPTYTLQAFSKAVMKMQAFAGLPETGMLDTETRKLFTMRRCGVKDIESTHASARRRRYILQQGWSKRSITYRVMNGSSTLEKSRVETLMAAGLEVWAPHGKLKFSKVDDGKADIQLSFASNEHGDGFPFDGRGHVVAHAFSPPYGEMHFDDDEIWRDNPDDEDDDDVTDFFAVAVHEIGHALGLCHSNVKSSVMYPYYQVPVDKLHSDDIKGMQELYLKEDLPELGPTEDPFVSLSSLEPRFTKADSEELDEDEQTTIDEDDVPDLCYANYDTLQVIQGKIYVFEEEWMWVLSDRRIIEEGYPKKFHKVFVGLPQNVSVIRTIYEKFNGNVVIFSGKTYWEFDSTFKFIKRGKLKDYSIPSSIPELQTVFLSNYNNKTYLIEYEKFWRYDENKGAMDKGYPKDMSAWRKLPYPIDAALVWQGDTYFFRGPRFWRFDNTYIQAHEYYPLPTAQVWFPCPATPDMNTFVTNDQL